MKVYVITQATRIVGVALDKKVAERCVEVHTRKGWLSPEIEEYDTDDLKKYTRPCWKVEFNPVKIRRTELTDEDWWWEDQFYVYADTEAHALAKAQEKRAKILAERAGQ